MPKNEIDTHFLIKGRNPIPAVYAVDTDDNVADIRLRIATKGVGIGGNILTKGVVYY